METTYQFTVLGLLRPVFRQERKYTAEGTAYFVPINQEIPSSGIQALDRLVGEVHAGRNLTEIAPKMGVTIEGLSGFIRLLTGMNGHDFVKAYRLEMAVRLLRYTRMSVGQVAQQCGYTQRNSLINAFQRAFHDTPSHYRQSIRAKGDVGRYVR
ncbi:MAG: AraC family transcriptional regulator [Prevotellaceae bacterium]|nr:AraC family transcriptional regulator [Prevotellaceae bacterium]